MACKLEDFGFSGAGPGIIWSSVERVVVYIMINLYIQHLDITVVLLAGLERWTDSLDFSGIWGCCCM